MTRDRATPASLHTSEDESAIHMAEGTSTLATRLRLLQLASQALPTGAFAYSCGLETAHELGYLNDERDCIAYLHTLLETTVVFLELPLFFKMQSAVRDGDPKGAARLSAYLLASRESREFQEQERQMGRALHRVLVHLYPERSPELAPDSFLEALARAAWIYGLSDEDAALLVVYTWIEQQVSALCRLIPLGPLAGQKVIDAVLGRAPTAIERARRVSDDEIGASAPQLSLMSALHETQYTRIFRS